MKTLAKTTALTGLLAISLVVEASAWERNIVVSGPRGAKALSAQGGCSADGCSRAAIATGVYGRTATRSGEVSCSGNSCTGSRTTTGPAGRSVQRSGSISR
jgi:hypothetical protein